MREGGGMGRRSSLAAAALIVGLTFIIPGGPGVAAGPGVAPGPGVAAGPQGLGQGSDASYTKSQKKVGAGHKSLKKKKK